MRKVNCLMIKTTNKFTDCIKGIVAVEVGNLEGSEDKVSAVFVVIPREVFIVVGS